MPRPNPNSLDVPWNPDDPCPCLSGQNYEDCCLRPDGLPLWQLPSLAPPGEISNISHEKCYMSSTANCSTKLSREHYISKSILSQFGGLGVEGLPWHDSEHKFEYGVEALTSKVLCTRHNSSLSPLDSMAGHAFKQITDAMIYVTKKSLARKTSYYFVSGDAFELWGVKSLLGLFTAKIASSNKTALAKDYEIDFDTACTALSGRGLNVPLGLYVHYEDERVNYGIGVSPLSNHDEKIAGGLRVNMLGVVFDFLIDTRGSNLQFFIDRTYYRPWMLDLNGPHRTARIIFTWGAQKKIGKRVSMDIVKK